MRKFLIIIFFITACTSAKNGLDNNLSDIKFDDDLSLKEFKIKLDDYARINPYPNIDE